MNISPVVKLAALGGLAVGAFGSALLIGSHHDATPAQIVVRQDAATSSLSAPAAAPSSSAAPARVTPSVAGASSTVVVKKPAVQPQEVAPVTDPTTPDPQPTLADPTAPATQPVDGAPAVPPGAHPINGSTEYNPYPTDPPTKP